MSLHGVVCLLTSPSALETLVRKNVDQVNYHLHNLATNLTHLKPKREFLKRSLKFRVAMFWNQLSNEAKLVESLPSFKKCIRMQLGLVKLSIFLVTTITLSFLSVFL